MIDWRQNMFTKGQSGELAWVTSFNIPSPLYLFSKVLPPVYESSLRTTICEPRPFSKRYLNTRKTTRAPPSHLIIRCHGRMPLESTHLQIFFLKGQNINDKTTTLPVGGFTINQFNALGRICTLSHLSMDHLTPSI